MPAPSSAFAHPAFLPYTRLVAELDLPHGLPELARLNAVAGRVAACNTRGLPLCFVEPGERLAARAYEQGIFDTGLIPTRADTWHDVLNALVWLRFPRLKSALNAAHVAAFVCEPGTARSPRRDALTMLDESGLLLAAADPALPALLVAREWETLFVARRAEVLAGMRFVVVGHALLEKCLAPWPGVTAKCLILPAAASRFAASTVDSAAGVDGAPAFAEESLAGMEAAALACLPELDAPRALPPLPVIGIPGWDAASAVSGFYANRELFRPTR